MNIEHNLLQARTNFLQHSRCSAGKISYKAYIENKSVQFLNWSALNDPKDNENLLGSLPISEGHMKGSTRLKIIIKQKFLCFPYCNHVLCCT